MNDVKLYDELLNEKNSGAVLDFDGVTYDQLKSLWYKEYIPDKYIADIYNVTKYKVTKKRNEFKITTKQCAIDDFLYYINNI